MKMIKAVKKLKFWSRKKIKRKSLEPQYPPTTQNCWCSCSSAQPSAPPLPPWLEAQQIQDAISAPRVQPLPAELANQSRAQFPAQEVPAETTSFIYATLPAVNDIIIPSYQQYMNPNPAFAMPVAQAAAREERWAGFFGCVLGFSVTLIRCFCSCFRIREANY